MMAKSEQPSPANTDSETILPYTKVSSYQDAYHCLLDKGILPVVASTHSLGSMLLRDFLSGLLRSLFVCLVLAFVLSALFAVETWFDLPQWLDLIFKKTDSLLSHGHGHGHVTP